MSLKFLDITVSECLRHLILFLIKKIIIIIIIIMIIMIIIIIIITVKMK